MPRRCRLIRPRTFAAGLILALAAGPAAALDLQTAKEKGWVGERPDGYVGAVVDKPAVADLVARVNKKRREKYAEVAAKNDIGRKAVAKIAAKKVIQRAGPGVYVKDPDDGWVKKKNATLKLVE